VLELPLRVVVDGRLSYVRAVPYRRLESVELPDDRDEPERVEDELLYPVSERPVVLP